MQRAYFVVFQRNAKGQSLLDRVFEYLELIEKDFFGLQFLDNSPETNVMVRSVAFFES